MDAFYNVLVDEAVIVKCIDKNALVYSVQGERPECAFENPSHPERLLFVVHPQNRDPSMSCYSVELKSVLTLFRNTVEAST